MSSSTPFEWIFLDIDGVLAPDNRYEDWEPETVDELCRFEIKPCEHLFPVLEEFGALQIAISSSWKEQFAFERAKALFPESLRGRVAGYTPFLDEPGTEWVRRREILQFLSERGQKNARWIAVDDLSGHFSKRLFGDQALIVLSAWHGFEAEDARRLRKALLTGETDFED